MSSLKESCEKLNATRADQNDRPLFEWSEPNDRNFEQYYVRWSDFAK